MDAPRHAKYPFHSLRGEINIMKKAIITLILACSVWLAGCTAPTVTTVSGSGKILPVPVEITTLPITADLTVSEQKTIGEAEGLYTETEILTKEAIAKALGQNPPKVEGPDVLVGIEVSTEQWGKDIKVTVTGYPAWYTNFRTAIPGDSALLVIPSTAGDNEGDGDGEGGGRLKFWPWGKTKH
jgi:predicted small secreted protein